MIAYAFVIEEAVAHPGEPLPMTARLALALGLALFVGGMAMAVWRATRRLPLSRVIVLTGTAVAVLVTTNVVPSVTLGIGFVGVALIAALEQVWNGPVADVPT